jgi:phenylpropionate dioxygenase-like ring-hydroxylating dioxygenase large terminal subunit
MRHTKDLLRAIRERARAPLAEVRALPPEAYRDHDLLALEHEAIFTKEWLCAGRAADIPKPGDYLSFQLGAQPVLLLRGSDHAVRGFSNVCLHRMMRLVEGRGNCKHIICPYHGWTYDLNGRVIGAGHMGRGLSANSERLPELRTEIWEGWIYVTLNPAAESIAARLTRLEEVVAPYRMAEFVPIEMQDHVWRTNWKLLTENFMEGYHLPVAHRRTVGAWFPVQETGFPDERFEAFTYQTFLKDQTATYGLAHPSNIRLEGRWRSTSVMPTIFPSHMFVLAPDHLWYLSLQPRAVGEVALRFGVAIAPEVMAALGDEAEPFARKTVKFFDEVNEEDRFVVERIYQNTAAPLAAPGRLSWLERELHDFFAYLDRRLNGADALERPAPDAGGTRVRPSG